MKIYVFGNPDHSHDSIAIRVAKQLEKKYQEIEFVYYDPVEDFPEHDRDVIILDAAAGIKKVVLIDNLVNLKSLKRSGLHDFDIAFELKLLKKIGRIDRVRVIAIPMTMKLSEAVRAVRRKLVAGACNMRAPAYI